MSASVSARRMFVLVGFTALVCPRLVQAQAADSFHYYYFDQKVRLTCDTSEIAVFEKTGNAGAPPAFAQGFPQLGIAKQDLSRTGLEKMWHARCPDHVRDARGVRDLVAGVAAGGTAEFVSPVFRDGRGAPVVIRPHLHVGFHESVSAHEAEALLRKMGVGVIKERNWARMNGVYRIKSHSRNGFEVLELANALAQRAEVKFAEPDMLLRSTKSLIPNDPLFPSQWGLHNTGQSGGTVDMDLDGPEAWDITTGDPSIIVVILDDGVQQDHPDINQIAGRDFTTMGTDGGPGNSCDNHGTTVAGCSSAIINNSLGVTGIAPDTNVVAAKYTISNVPCDGSGTFSATWLVNALDWAQSLGARVSNNSNGLPAIGSITTKYQQTYDAGMIHFSSSGNSGINGIGYPASLPTVNAVGAINRYGNRASFSTYGTGLAFMAPGQSVWTTDRTGSAGYSGSDYVSVNGTSYSSPYAAGVAAMILSVNDTLSPPQIEQIMNDTCMDRGAAGYDTFYGWGILQTYDGMLQASPDVTLEGNCFYDVAMTDPVDTVAVDVFNLDGGASWRASTTLNYYNLVLQPGRDINAGDTLRLIAKDGTNWINVTDHVVTQPQIDAGSIVLDLVLDEFYLDLTDFPMYEADPPDYSQYTGPATAQMVLNYIWWDSNQDPTPPATFDDQTVLYDYGIANNATPGLDVLDLVGMWRTIQDHRPLPYSQFGYNFSKRHDVDSAEMVKQIAQWIAYPIGTYGGHQDGFPEHVPGVIPAYGGYSNWMAVRGIHTSENAYPLPPALDVYGVWVNDPFPASLGGIGENSYKTIDEFLATYYLPLTTGDGYDGEFVAICEPPDTDGKERLFYIESPVRFSDEAKTVIDAVRNAVSPSDELVAEANNWIVQAAIDGVSEQLIPYDDNLARRFAGTDAGTPLLVLNETGDDYYAVPFDTPVAAMSSDVSSGDTTVVVLVDAEEGNFKEASWVSTPVVYLPISQESALKIADGALRKAGLNARTIKRWTAELVHISSTPYYPHWRVLAGGYIVTIAQDGTTSVSK